MNIMRVDVVGIDVAAMNLAIRESRLKAREVAQRAEIHPQSLSRIRKQKRGYFDTIARIAKAVSVPVDSLIAPIPEPDKSSRNPRARRAQVAKQIFTHDGASENENG